jgi:hypothetical protein
MGISSSRTIGARGHLSFGQDCMSPVHVGERGEDDEDWRGAGTQKWVVTDKTRRIDEWLEGGGERYTETERARERERERESERGCVRM